MKVFILTSSIFYLLGLKLTNQVELNQQSAKDTVHIQVKTQKELVLPEQDTPKLPQMESDQQEMPVSSGSNENTAPWAPEKETLEIN
ncbi:hypothetical protein ACUNWD_17125 [Sunxiuqinia sp. A32]|uniref:hypothetical protein n=1 Tax=Sunxiuqinia sp. A32 TaxID=3461496 RepID=UPI00404640CD